MPEHDPFDKDLGFDEQEELQDHWEAARPKRSLLLRMHWLSFVVLLNVVSLSVLLFLYSNGHPIELIKMVSGKIFAGPPSEEELLLEDAQRIRAAIMYVKGQDVKYSVHRYYGEAMWETYYKYDSIMNARSNSLTQLPSGYYYLSADRQRLYKCIVEEKREAEIYQDGRGVWTNRSMPRQHETQKVYETPEMAEARRAANRRRIEAEKREAEERREEERRQRIEAEYLREKARLISEEERR